MDAVTIGAALALVNQKLTGVDQATQAANTAAQAANKAAQDAQGWSTLTDESKHILTAVNMHLSIAQAEMRDLRKTVESLQAQIKALA